MWERFANNGSKYSVCRILNRLNDKDFDNFKRVGIFLCNIADAYVEIRLNDQLQRTTTCRKSLNPVWKEEFRFEATKF